MSIRFPATVAIIKAGSRFTDGKPRVVVRIAGCDSPFNEIEFAIPDADLPSDYQLEQQLSVVIGQREPVAGGEGMG